MFGIRLSLVIAAFAVLTCAGAALAGPTALKPAAAPTTKPVAVRQFQLQETIIPAGAEGQVVVVFASQGPLAGLNVEEGKPVQLPVAGRVGNVNLPQGTLLIGSLTRVNENSGVYRFTSMMIGDRVYMVEIESDPVPGRLQADPYSLQTVRDSKDLAITGVRERRGVVEGQATRSYGRAGGAIVGAVTNSWKAGLITGALGSIIGTAQITGAVQDSTTKQEEILNRDIPSMMVATVAPMQPLRLFFRTNVNLNAPVATLGGSALPQGTAAIPNAPATPAAAYPASPVGPSPVYPGAYGYPYPVAPQPAYPPQVPVLTPSPVPYYPRP